MALFSYVSSLSEETHEWLLVLFVDAHLQLLAVETAARGSVSEVRVDAGHIVCRGRSMGAAGFFLVHNHPSGDATPSQTDRQLTARLSRLSHDMDMPLLDHCIVAGGKMTCVLWE